MSGSRRHTGDDHVMLPGDETESDSMQQDENDDSYEEIPWPDFDTYGASASDGGISLDTHNMCELDLVRWLVQANGKMTGKCHGEAGGTWTYHLLQLIVIAASLLACPAMAYGNAKRAGMVLGPNSLNWVSASTAPIGALALLLPLHDTLRLLGPAGKLQKLKTFAASKHADKRVYITKKSAFMLRIARASLLLLDVFFILFGLLMFKSAHDSYKKSQYMDGTETYVIFSTLVGVVLVVVFPILCSGWWLSLKVSLSITNGAINNVVMGVHTWDKLSLEDKSDPETWLRLVAEKAMRLDGPYLRSISLGWGIGLIGVCVFCFSFSFSFFTMAINAPFWKGVDILHDWEPGTTRDLYFGFSIAFAIMPTPFMVEVADLSLMCKKLVDTINAARCRNFKVKDDCIWRVERALEGCNLGKGIGFTAKLVKIDTALVGGIALTVVRLFATVIPLALALQPLEHGVARQEVCNLEDSHVGFLNSCVEACLRDRPQEAYNSTARDAGCYVVPAACVDCMVTMMRDFTNTTQLVVHFLSGTAMHG